jgi:hypothetical protein
MTRRIHCKHMKSRAFLVLNCFLISTLLLWQLTGCQRDIVHAAAAVNPPLISASQLSEVSGIAESGLHDQRLWAINDSGNSNLLHAIDGGTGALQASIRVAGSSNIDWEDLAAFSLGNQHWLLIADVGDNTAQRRYGHLYLVPEPDWHDNQPPAEIQIAAELVFSYEDGARDVEAVAVDTQRREIILISKRDTPPGVYVLPLRLQTTSQPLLARRIADISGLQPPHPSDRLRFGRYSPYVAQPTALDIKLPSRAGQPVSAVLLTYKHAYLFQRPANSDWRDVWQAPRVIEVPPMQQTEALAFNRDGCSLWVTTEQLPAPLYQIESGLCND